MFVKGVVLFKLFIEACGLVLMVHLDILDSSGGFLYFEWLDSLWEFCVFLKWDLF